jgi:hypothetical protein
MEEEDTNLNSSPCDDTHKEVRDNAGNGHHQALNYSHTGIKAEDKEYIMFKSWVEADHEVTNGSRKESYQNKEWHCREGVADDKCSYTIMAIQPLSLKNLQQRKIKLLDSTS